MAKEKHLIRPGERELSEVQERNRLPKDEKQLHALLMTEGDLAAGELDIPVEWLDSLAKEGRVLYLEQGLWIAAEQEAEYDAALGGTEVAKAALQDCLGSGRRKKLRDGKRRSRKADRF